MTCIPVLFFLQDFVLQGLAPPTAQSPSDAFEQPYDLFPRLKILSYGLSVVHCLILGETLHRQPLLAQVL